MVRREGVQGGDDRVNSLRSQVPSVDILCGGFPVLNAKGSDKSGCPRGRTCVWALQSTRSAPVSSC
jgi:hypothetical protein